MKKVLLIISIAMLIAISCKNFKSAEPKVCDSVSVDTTIVLDTVEVK
jgi:hypothetical protein